MSEGGEARNHEAEVEAVARALAVIRDRAKYLSEPAWTLEGCAIVGRQIYKLACEAEAALDAVRRSPQGEDYRPPLESGAPDFPHGSNANWYRRAPSPQDEDHEAPPPGKFVFIPADMPPDDGSGYVTGTAYSRMVEHYEKRLAESGTEPDTGRQSPQSEDHEAGIEAAAQALCAWPSVKVDDREHNTATHMATDAIAAYLSRCPSPERDQLTRLVAGIQWVRGMCSDEEPYEVIDAKLAELLDEDHETSDAVRGDPCGTPVEWPGRQPTDPDRGQLRDAAIPASGRGRQSAQGEDHEAGMVGRPDCEDCGIAQALRADLVALRSRASASERDTEKLQRAIDVAFGAMNSSAYVGGPTEREAWLTALAALGEVVTQHTGQGDVLAGGSSTTEE